MFGLIEVFLNQFNSMLVDILIKNIIVFIITIPFNIIMGLIVKYIVVQFEKKYDSFREKRNDDLIKLTKTIEELKIKIDQINKKN